MTISAQRYDRRADRAKRSAPLTATTQNTSELSAYRADALAAPNAAARAADESKTHLPLHKTSTMEKGGGEKVSSALAISREWHEL